MKRFSWAGAIGQTEAAPEAVETSEMSPAEFTGKEEEAMTKQLKYGLIAALAIGAALGAYFFVL